MDQEGAVYVGAGTVEGDVEGSRVGKREEREGGETSVCV